MLYTNQAYYCPTGLGTPSATGTAHANHQSHQLLPRNHTRLAELLAIRARAEARSQAAPASSQPQLASFHPTIQDAGSSTQSQSQTPTGAPVAPALATATETSTDSVSDFGNTSSRSSSDTDSDSEVQTPVDDIPIVLVTDHSDDEHAGMTSLSYTGDLSELTKEPASEKEKLEREKRTVGPFRFPPPKCDPKELLSPNAIPRSMWTKKSRPAAAQRQRRSFTQHIQQPMVEIDLSSMSAGRAQDVVEMGRLLEALMVTGSGKDYEAQRVKDTEALNALMAKMKREIQEKGCPKQEANMIIFQILKSVGAGLARKLEEENGEESESQRVVSA